MTRSASRLEGQGFPRNIQMKKLNRRLMIIGVAACATTAVGFPHLSFAVSEPTLGLSLPLTGSSSEVGAELLAGYQIAVSASGRAMALKVLDDESNAVKAAANAKLLGADSSVLAISGISGTASAQAVLPVAREYGLPVIGMRSGAKSLRNGQEGVYHLRASYADEMNKIAKACRNDAISTVQILYSDEPFGVELRDHLTSRLELMKVTYETPVPTQREGGDLDLAVKLTVANMQKISKSSAVVLLLSPKTTVKAAQLLRQKHNTVAPFFALSTAATKYLATKEDQALTGLGLVTVFPLPRSDIFSLSKKFREDVEKFGKPDMLESLIIFESYLYGSVIIAATQKAGTRDALIKQLNAGIQVAGQPFVFDAERVGYHYVNLLVKSRDGRLRA